MAEGDREVVLNMWLLETKNSSNKSKNNGHTNSNNVSMFSSIEFKSLVDLLLQSLSLLSSSFLLPQGSSGNHGNHGGSSHGGSSHEEERENAFACRVTNCMWLLCENNENKYNLAFSGGGIVVKTMVDVLKRANDEYCLSNSNNTGNITNMMKVTELMHNILSILWYMSRDNVVALLMSKEGLVPVLLNLLSLRKIKPSDLINSSNDSNNTNDTNDTNDDDDDDSGKIEEIKKLLKMKGRQEAMIILGNLTTLTTTSREMIQKSGVVPKLVGPLVSLLSEGNEEEKEEIVYACGSVAKVKDVANLLSDRGVLRMMIGFLQNGSQKLKENTSFCLGNMALTVKNELLIGVEGGIPLLINMLNDEISSDTAKQWCALCLANLSFYPANRAMIDNAGGIPRLIDMLSKGNTKGKQWAALALANITSEIKNNCDNAVLPLLELLSSDQESSPCFIGLSLGNIFLHNRGALDRIAASVNISKGLDKIGEKLRKMMVTFSAETELNVNEKELLENDIDVTERRKSKKARYVEGIESLFFALFSMSHHESIAIEIAKNEVILPLIFYHLVDDDGSYRGKGDCIDMLHQLPVELTLPILLRFLIIKVSHLRDKIVSQKLKAAILSYILTIFFVYDGGGRSMTKTSLVAIGGGEYYVDEYEKVKDITQTELIEFEEYSRDLLYMIQGLYDLYVADYNYEEQKKEVSLRNENYKYICCTRIKLSELYLLLSDENSDGDDNNNSANNNHDANNGNVEVMSLFSVDFEGKIPQWFLEILNIKNLRSLSFHNCNILQ